MIETSAEGNDSCPLGADKKHSLPLHGVTKHDFELLLSMLYPLDPFLTLQEKLFFDWNSAWILADRLGMEGLHHCCVNFLRSQISVMAPAEKVFIGRELGIPEVLIQALKEVVTRYETLHDCEAELLGAKTAFRIMQLREHVISPQKKYLTQNKDMVSVIKWIFRAELSKMGSHVREDIN